MLVRTGSTSKLLPQPVSLTLAPPRGLPTQIHPGHFQRNKVGSAGTITRAAPIFESLLRARHCITYFTCLFAFNPHHNHNGIDIVTDRKIVALSHEIICQISLAEPVTSQVSCSPWYFPDGFTSGKALQSHTLPYTDRETERKGLTWNHKPS